MALRWRGAAPNRAPPAAAAAAAGVVPRRSGDRYPVRPQLDELAFDHAVVLAFVLAGPAWAPASGQQEHEWEEHELPDEADPPPCLPLPGVVLLRLGDFGAVGGEVGRRAWRDR